MKAFTAAALTALLFAGILTLWIPGRWAVSLFQAGAFALAIAWVARFATRPYPLFGSVIIIPLAGAVVWGLVQLALGQSVYRWETWTELLKWGTNLVLFVLALQVFSDPARRERFLRSVLYFGAALSVVASIQLYSAEGRVFWLFPTEHKEFVLGPFVYHNQYAAFVELILPLAVVGALEDRRKAPAYAAMAATLYASVIAAASRTGAILVTAEILLIVFVARRRNRAITFGLLAALAVLFTAVAGWDVLWRRFLLADPFSDRREFFLSSVAMIRDRPFIGFGLGTWSTAYPAYALRDNGLLANQAHNDWAQWAVEGGLPFLMLMLWIAARSIRPAFRTLWGIGVLAVFVHSLVDYPLQRPALAGLFFVFLAVMESARKIEKKS